MSHKKFNKRSFLPKFLSPVEKPTLEINPEPYAVMYHATQAATGEVSGLGKIVKLSPTRYALTEAIILGQNSSAGYTVLSDEAMNEFLYELAKKKKNPSEFNLWWHSHGNLPVFWSSVDEENARRLTENRELLSVVMNKEGKLLARLDTKSGTTDRLSFVIMPQEIKGLKEKIYEEVKTKVKPGVYPKLDKANKPLTNYYDDYYGDDLGWGGSYINPGKWWEKLTEIQGSFKGFKMSLRDQYCPKCGWKGKEETQIIKCPSCKRDTLQLGKEFPK